MWGGYVVDRKVALEEVFMQKSDRGFEQIMSAVLEQKQVWEKLQAENRELRQQLMDLRAGRGIFIEIGNQRFELVWEPHRTDAPTGEASAGKRPQQASKNSKGPAQPPSMASSGVLEEMLLDEFSSAMGSHRVSPHEERKPSASFNEEQKATLRRELSGSFLLE
jgi:hypothetical protein